MKIECSGKSNMKKKKPIVRQSQHLTCKCVEISITHFLAQVNRKIDICLEFLQTLLDFIHDQTYSVQYHKGGNKQHSEVKQLVQEKSFLQCSRRSKMRDVSWSFIILSCTSFLIVAINAIVCVFVVTNIRLRTYTNGFLVSLAVSDILTGGLFFPVHLSGPDSPVASSEGYLIAFVLISGVGNICLVTWDRYIAVVKPFTYKKTVKCHFKKLIIVTWATALVISLLPLTWQTDSNVVIHNVYLFCLMGFFVVIPYAAIFCAYIKISQSLKNHRKRIRKHSTISLSSKRMRSEAKVTKVLLAIVIIFVLSWLPIIYMTTVASVNRPDLSPVALQKVSLLTVALSSLANPLLYAFMKEDFRREFKKFSSHQRRSSISASAIELKTSTAACSTETSRKYTLFLS